MVKPKEVYYLTTTLSGRCEERPHYTVVVFVEGQEALLVPICSKRPYAYDSTVELDKTEYGRLDRASFVEFKQASLMSLKALAEMVTSGRAKQCEVINGQVYLKIKNGCTRSKMTPRKIKRWIENLSDPSSENDQPVCQSS